jgi:biopolymer transport protein ExbB
VFGTLVTYFQQGGLVMWPLLACAILGMTFVIERAWALFQARRKSEEFMNRVQDALFQQRSLRHARQLCDHYQLPVARILKAGLIKHGTSDEEIEKAIEIAITHELARLERGLGVLASVSNVAPLLGFLGTVTGMIQSFGELAQAGLSNPGRVAAGISEALITTAAGLFIAVPVLMAYNFYSAQIQRMILEMETAANLLLEAYAVIERAAIEAPRPAAVQG